VPYWVRFSLTVLSLGAFTSAFVLVVLPQRFVLQAGLVESGITFPTTLPPFLTPARAPVIRPRIPPPPPIQPGPAERFWHAILPLLRAGQLDAAVPRFRAYLAVHPGDRDIWREFAVVLTRLGQYDEAEAIYLRLLATSDDPRLTLQLARLLRDRGERERSLALYRQLVAAQPADATLAREFAQVLTWAEAYGAAADVYRQLLARDPADHGLRLDLARVLYWGGQRTDALRVLWAIPADAAEATAAGDLRAVLERELAPPPTTADTLLEQARRAVVAQNLDGATRLYERLLERDPDDPALWLEWADFLQYQKQDLPAARDALTHLGGMRSLTWAERFRLAQLHAWTGEEQQAKSMLLGLLEEDSTQAEAWALLGNLYRFENARIDAQRAYRNALELDPRSIQALEGQRGLERQTAQVIATRERPSAGPELFYFRDSDEYRRFDIGARATFLWGATAVVARAGYRTLEGVALAGAPGSEEGPFFHVELARWWRLGTVRTSVSAGVEHLDAFGTEPTLGVRLVIPDAGGAAVALAYDHGPAFHRTVTLESILGVVRSDHLQASVFRPLGRGWSLAGLGAATSLRGGGTNNWRFNGFVTLRRQVLAPLSVALTSQFLAFSSAAPVLDTRRLYWDPKAFWSGGVQLEARTRPASAWQLYGRLTPGVGLVRERIVGGLDLVPQLATEAGVGYESPRIVFAGGLAYLRGREGEYNSFGANVSLAVRY
jgi:tetratricopeptide (TPR) repeat protein